MALLPGQRCPTPPCPLAEHMKRRRAEFQEKVAGVFVPFIWGPDFFGYEEETDFVLCDGVYHERNSLVRITDHALYPQEWKDFMRWQTKFGLKQIHPHRIVEEEVGSPVNPVDVSEDEEEYVPAPMEMSDDDSGDEIHH
jgi:hypothetical protein